jgi:hypothetical protein
MAATAPVKENGLGIKYLTNCSFVVINRVKIKLIKQITMETSNEISINGVGYVRKDSVVTGAKAQELDGLKYCVVRTYSAGVFAGYVKSRVGGEGVVLQARRLFYWDGAASLSQLSQEGVTKPQNCKFPMAVPEVELTNIIEIIECTEKARLNIANVPIWAM